MRKFQEWASKMLIQINGLKKAWNELVLLPIEKRDDKYADAILHQKEILKLGDKLRNILEVDNEFLGIHHVLR